VTGFILALIHRWNLPQFLYNWQTLIAGVLAVLAAWRTIRATTKSADREVKASQEQTAVAQKQIETTVRLERERVLSEASAFHAMLEAAMTRVLDEAAWAKETYPDVLAQLQGLSHQAFVVRQCITKGAFAELRAACVRQGGPLTGEFLDLEREIDSFTAKYKDLQRHAGLREQLALIETKADALREKAFERFSGSVAAPGPFATAEAEALIGATAPPVSAPEPRRSLLRWWFGWRAAG
jgi:hypothetical protein